jgi:hypothetical protein
MSLRRWQKLTAARTRNSVPSGEGPDIGLGAFNSTGTAVGATGEVVILNNRTRQQASFYPVFLYFDEGVRGEDAE